MERLLLAFVSLGFIGVFASTYMISDGSRLGQRATGQNVAAPDQDRTIPVEAEHPADGGREAFPATAMASTVSARPGGPSPKFTICFTGGGVNCVVDGDTAWIDGEKIRVADIDAPETHPPRCAHEADLGTQATTRLAALMNAGFFWERSIDRDTDRYGRKLRILERNGRSLGGELVAEGLARPWEGHRRPWC